MPWDVGRGGRRNVKRKMCDVVLVEQKLYACWLQFEVVTVSVLWHKSAV
jgi:hypothetical protein